VCRWLTTLPWFSVVVGLPARVNDLQRKARGRAALEVAEDFVCNGIAIGGRVLSSMGVEAMATDLTHAGFKVLPLPMSEFIKSGGGVRCLSLQLD